VARLLCFRVGARVAGAGNNDDQDQGRAFSLFPKQIGCGMAFLLLLLLLVRSEYHRIIEQSHPLCVLNITVLYVVQSSTSTVVSGGSLRVGLNVEGIHQIVC
jgi:hypothetical protein